MIYRVMLIMVSLIVGSINHFRYLDRQIQMYFNKFEHNMPCRVTDKFNIQWYPENGGYKVWHFERTEKRHSVKRHLVWMTYLTDNPDGGTEFLYQDLYVPAEKGKTLIWLLSGHIPIVVDLTLNTKR